MVSKVRIFFSFSKMKTLNYFSQWCEWLPRDAVIMLLQMNDPKL